MTAGPMIAKPMTAVFAVGRVRRDLAVGLFVRLAMAAAVFVALFWNLGPDVRTTLLTVLAVGWVVLSIGSRRGTLLAAQATELIASGQFDQAEDALTRAMNAFSVSRPPKLLSLHQFAVLRHAQQRWPDAAQLSRAVLSHRLGPLRGLDRPARLILAESSLQMGDLPTTYRTLSSLHQMRLPLADAVRLLVIQLGYESQIGAWPAILLGLAKRVELTELMPPQDAVRSLEVLSTAAEKVGQPELSRWLGRRAVLLGGLPKQTSASDVTDPLRPGPAFGGTGAVGDAAIDDTGRAVADSDPGFVSGDSEGRMGLGSGAAIGGGKAAGSASGSDPAHKTESRLRDT